MDEEIDRDALRERLENRLAELEAAQDARDRASATVELDQTRTGRLSRMDALQQQAMAQESDRRAQQEMQRIRGALRRMDEGTYGECLQCEEPITPGRLHADPSVLFCLECAGSRTG